MNYTKRNIKALTKQIEYANKTVDRYGKDQSGDNVYCFDEYGFRVQPNSTTVTEPDVLFFGGSTSFGVGVPFEQTFPCQLSGMLGISIYNMSYACCYYDNKLIYETIVQAKDAFATDNIVVQWVTDKRNPDDPITVDQYVSKVKEIYPKSVHTFIDGADTWMDLPNDCFQLINPVWFDSAANNTHPGPKTHHVLAKFCKKYLNV